MLDHGQATAFLSRLHGQVNGQVAWLTKSPATGRVRPWLEAPLRLPPLLLRGSSREGHVWVSVASFVRGRCNKHVLSVPALWADLDPVKEETSNWRQRALAAIKADSPLPTIVVDSGRGFHVYWLFNHPLQVEGRSRRVGIQVKQANRVLAERLGGDCVGDISRVMRLPGSTNPKNGRRCLILWDDGPTYDAPSLFDELGVAESPSEPPTTGTFPTEDLRTPTPPPRRRGRPSLGVTVRDLRSLPPSARDLVVGGVWRGGRRYVDASSRPDRSRADLAAVSAMVGAGWSDQKIRTCFERADWLIGDRFRGLWEREGKKRALDYLTRTIARARQPRYD